MFISIPPPRQKVNLKNMNLFYFNYAYIVIVNQFTSAKPNSTQYYSTY